MFGTARRKNICQPVAPCDSAAYSSSLSCACISVIYSRATKGQVTNTEDTDEGLRTRGPQGRGRLLDLRLDIFDHRLQHANEKWQADEGQGDDDSQRRKSHLEAQRFKVPANPAVAGVE